jgi:hypothetical protein
MRKTKSDLIGPDSLYTTPMARNRVLQTFRITHLYFGVFIAPALLFFAFTGAMQTFGLHETNRDHPNYKPAHWIAVLAQIHKKQTDLVPVRKPQPPSASAVATGNSAAGADSDHPHRRRDQAAAEPAGVPAPAPLTVPVHHNPLPLRIFFLVVCIGLFTSTATGIYMSYKFNRNRRLVSLTLAAGVIIPPLLLLV